MRPLRAIAFVALLALPFTAAAQDVQTYPNRAVRIIVPFPAGGPTDILTRIVAQKLSENWGQPVVVENRPGADTAIGAVQVAKASPDGYTLLAPMDTTLVMNPATKTSLPYDPFKDFAPITLAAKNTSLLTVRAADGPKSIQELIALGKAKAGKMNYGAGIITTRLAGYLFNKSAGIDVQLIPYKGSAEVVQGLLTGAVDYIIDGTASSLPLIKGGQFRALAKLNNRPLPSLPDVQAALRSRRHARARRHFELDRLRRAGRHAAPDRRQDPARGGEDLRRPGSRREAGELRHQRGEQHAGRIRRLLPQGGGALGKGIQGKRHQARLITKPPPACAGQTARAAPRPSAAVSRACSRSSSAPPA